MSDRSTAAAVYWSQTVYWSVCYVMSVQLQLTSHNNGMLVVRAVQQAMSSMRTQASVVTPSAYIHIEGCIELMTVSMN